MSKRLSEDVANDSDGEEIPFKIRKNLYATEFEKPTQDDHMQVYLRIRPFTDAEEEQNENQDCLEIEEHNVLTHAPKSSHSYKNCVHGLQKTTNKYTFSKIYNQETTQKEFFNGTMLGIVKNFIDGQNCLVFSYGVTSSGKTYTIQGEPRDAGILPRALDVLFNSINNKHLSGYVLKPKMFMDVVKLTKEEGEEERRNKERTLKLSNDEDPDVMSLLGDDASDASQLTNITTCSESSNVSFLPNKESLDPTEALLDIESRVREETKVMVDDQGQILFSIWVSFAEIYNEQIFDLLMPISKKKNARRPVLRLSDDRNGSPYIKGLKEICVHNADEAYKLLTIGKRNLQTACTKLNHQSSRSHCIFNIKIIRVVDKANPRMARVSMLSLCDLAGSERSAKTQSVGDRLKEAGNINTSLMTLGRCIEMLRYNQSHKEHPKIIPFRDSKLTRLFQNFFSGQGRVNMIVNVNQCASMFDETQHVFKFSAIAKQVVITQKPDLKTRLLQSAKKTADLKKRAVSISWATPGQMREMNSAANQGASIPLPEGNEDDDLEEDDLDVEELLETIKDLQSKLLKERREKLQLELKIRDEVCSEMMKQLVEIEDECSERIRMNEEATEEMYEKRIQILMDAYENQGKKQSDFMTDKDDEWVSSILFYQEQMKNKEKDAEIDRLRKELHEAKIKQVLVNGQSSTSGSSDMGESVLLETLTKQLEEVKATLKEKDEEIKELNEMLTEAGETFQAKEKEIQDLKHSLEEDKADKDEQVAELEKALIESKKALEMADQKIKSRDETVETTRKTLQDEVDSLRTSLDSWKIKFEKEEEESLKREQALINGYKAEIANLKNQLSAVKAEHRHNSPCKSPSKHRKHQDHFMEDLSKQLKDLQEEFDRNSAATLELEEALHKTKQMNEELEVKNSKQTEENETAQAKIEELGRKCEELESTVRDLQREKEEGVKRVEELKENYEKSIALEKDIEGLKSKVAEKDVEIAELKEQANKLNVSMGKDMQFQLDEANIEISQLQSERKKLERKAVNLEKLYKEKTKQNMELNDELNKMKVAKEMLEEDLQDQEETEEKMEKLSNENDELKQRVEELETELKQQQGNSEERIVIIQKENADLKEKIEKLKEDITKEEHISSALKSELESATTEIKNIEKTHETHQKYEKIIKDLEDKVANCPGCQEWQKKNVEIESALETVKGEVSHLQTEVGPLKEELTTLRSDLKAKNVEVSDFEERFENVKCELAKRDQTFVETLVKLEQTKDQYDALKQEMKILKENLEKKEGELERLQLAQAEVMEQLNTTNDQVHELSDAKLKFAEMKSSLHMQKTLNEKVKADLAILKEEKSKLISNEEKLKEQIKCLEQRNQCVEGDRNELSGLKAELREMKKSCTESEEKWKILQEEKTEMENKCKELQHELSKVSAEKEEMSNECVQKVSKLETKLETIEKNYEDLKNLNTSLQVEKSDISQKLENLTQELGNKNDVIDNKEKILTDLQHELKEAENSAERQNSITSELNDMKAKCKELEQIKVDLENKVTQASQDSVQKNDVHNRKLIQELSDCHRKIEELQEVKESLEEKVENLKSEISTVSKGTREDSCDICPTIHKELDSSHDREQTLKKQLQTAGENIGELNNKICDLEDQVSKLNQRIQEAEDKQVHQEPRLSMPGCSVDLDNLREELTQKLDVIRELQGELVKKDSKLQTEKMKYKQLLEERSDEHRRYEAAMKDVTANEECIGVLKTALSEQEETMEHQDILIQQHEKNIEKSQKECEKYMNMYQSLLSTTNTSSIEIRDLSKKVCDLSVEIERVRSEKKDLENNMSVLKKQEAEHQHLAQENLSLRETKSAVKELEEKLSQVRDEKERLQVTLKSVTSQVESLQQEKQILEDKLEKTQERDFTSDKKLGDMAAKLSDFEVQYNKRENEFKVMREQKGKLEAILKENNAEMKDLEKSLSETRAECEALKSDAKKEARDQLSGIQKEHETVLADMKIKIREKDHSLRNSNKQIRQLEDEVKELAEKNKGKDAQMKAWKEEKDKLVSSLTEIIEKQKEDKEKVMELEKEKSRLEALVQDQVETIKQITSSGSSVRKSRLRNTSVSLDVSNLDTSETPLRRTSTRRGRKRRSYSMPDIETPASKKKDSDISLLSEDVGDERERIQIDATPSVAAKTLRRTWKKPRSSTDLLREDTKDSSKSKAADKENKSMKRIGSLLSALKKSPISKSAKKHLAEIKEMPSPNYNLGSSLVEVEDCGTQMSAEKVKETSSRKKSRHALYKEPLQISEPLDCGQFIHTTPEENIHETVKKRLRGRPRK